MYRGGLLIIFLLIVKPLVACEVTIIWDNEQAIGLSWCDDDQTISINELSIRKLNATIPVLGNFERISGDIQFLPLIHLTRGVSYQIFNNDVLYAEIQVPIGEQDGSARVLNIFPKVAEWPANILKGYIEFSEPMGELPSKNFLSICNEKGEALEDVFLELNPDLWNPNQTVLTFWFNPGRIKRGLNPNLEKGNPLATNQKYTIKIKDTWLTKKGTPLKDPFSFSFITGEPDRKQLQVIDWIIEYPKQRSTDPIIVRFNKSLDYFLLKDCFDIINEKGLDVPTTQTINMDGTSVAFIPQTPWGENLAIKIKTKLEDLAGNNLIRPFDREIGNNHAKSEVRNFITIPVEW